MVSAPDRKNKIHQLIPNFMLALGTLERQD